MSYSNQDKATALGLWLAGKSYREIEQATGITTNTLIKWNEAYGWESLKEEHLRILNETVVESIYDFKNRMLTQLEEIRTELISDFKISKSASKDKVVSGILEVNKQMLLLKGLPVDISKVNQHVEVAQRKLEDYFR